MTLNLRLCAIAIALCCAITSFPQTADQLELSLEANINTPAITSKHHGAAVEKASELSRSLSDQGMRTTTMRDGEVVMASLPCDTLFAANAIEPKPEAMKRLRPLLDIVSQPTHYKLLVAVHTDNTGDDPYSDSLSEARANAIDDLLWQLAGREDTNVVIYGLGKDEPLNDNSTRDLRRANRRVEFYIVPL